MEFEPVIGLEVHAQLNTATKIFCGCPTRFGAPPNTQVCPICLGLPGTLPVLNREVVAQTIRMALATHCEIAPLSRFARKNYFYPDIPKGYQISQYELPIARGGRLDIDTAEGPQRIGITRIHMEEDAGKLIHDPHAAVSLVDLNRAGMALMEIVSEPDLRSAEAAGLYLRRLRELVRWIGAGDANMEEGGLRCDANVSVRPKGARQFGTRIELKNLNSFKHVEKALRYEIARQIDTITAGGRLVQETRLWDPDQGVSVSMRGKEQALDYRYFPDPDLPPLTVDQAWVAALAAALPELPDQRRARFVAQYGLSDYDAGVLTGSRELADYYEACLDHIDQPKLAANWIMGALLGLLNSREATIAATPIGPAALAELLRLIDSGRINAKTAKTVFDAMAAGAGSATAIVNARGLAQVSDSAAITQTIETVLAAHPAETARYRQGETRLLGFFVGQAMRAMHGQANPQLLNQLLRARLDQNE